MNSIMKAAGTYKITRQGQITLPASVRENLKLREGQVLDFYYSDDTILIKKKKEPIAVFRELATKTRQQFKEEKVTRGDVKKAIEAVRKAKHASNSV